MIRPELAGNPDFRNRFRQEVDAARRVHGLYTAQVLDADPEASPPWLVTAYVPGLSLQEGVARHGPLPVDTVLVLMAGVAEALEVIHAAGVIHRDLKPSNVLLAPDGPRVIDFGIARAAETRPLTGSGIRIGSPHYMAPEQVADAPVGPAADVFALGSLAAYAALGRSPFGEGDALPVMYRVLHEPADLSGCPSPLRAIIERCLSKAAADRPAPAEVISWCRSVTAGRTRQIAQPWLPPGVAAALVGRAPVPPSARAAAPERAAAPDRAGVIAALPAASVAPPAERARPQTASVAQPAASAGPTVITTRQQQERPGTTTGPAGPTAPAPNTAAARPTAPAPAAARIPARRRARPVRTAAVVMGLLVLLAVVSWLADSRTPAGRSASGGADRPSGAASAPASWLVGTWTGTASQPAGVVTHWTAQLTFPRAGRACTFRFPSLGCSGTLVVTSATRTTASVHENLKRNPRKVCVPGGLMTLTRTGSTGLEMRWQDASHRSNVATADLSRR